MGLVLGWVAVPAILVALALQAVFFGFGGILVLGVNALNGPAGPGLRRPPPAPAMSTAAPGIS